VNQLQIFILLTLICIAATPGAADERPRNITLWFNIPCGFQFLGEEPGTVNFTKYIYFASDGTGYYGNLSPATQTSEGLVVPPNTEHAEQGSSRWFR